MRRLVATALALALFAGPSAADCRLALALGLDVSGSVDMREYDLQKQGLAGALDDEEVRRAIFALPDAPVAIAIFEWSSSSYQRVIQDWVLIEDEATLAGVVSRIANWAREPAPEATGIGAALLFGKALTESGPPCWDRTLDISGDGQNNDWPTPVRLRRRGQLGDLRVNALVVARRFSGDEDAHARAAAELAGYFRAQVIHGPGAFAEIARGFEDYRDAMTRKLLRELTTMPIGQAPPTPRERGVLAFQGRP